MQRKLKRLHFVGIGGIGMAALAELLHTRGFTVTGSDLKRGPITNHLESLGVSVSTGHDAGLLGDSEVVVRSTAIPDANVELEAARAAHIPVISRGELLAEIIRGQDAVAVGGSHGKTTTSAMAAHILEYAGLDPTALIGGRVPRPDGCASPTRLGGSDLLVAEVDESDGSFLLTRPVVAVVTNADPEHLDYYGTREALLDAFVEFANSVPFWGAAILGIDHPGVAEIEQRINVRKIRFGFGAVADVRALDVEAIAGGQRFKVSTRGQDVCEYSISLPGRHNVLNSLAAIAVALEFDVPQALIAEALGTFPGVGRRFERKGIVRGIEVVDDYAHHPAEIEATLRAARSIHSGRIVAIFQPHRYSRTRDCWTEFLHCFGDADRIIISEIYAASEAPIPGIDGASLASAISEASQGDVHFGGSLDSIASSLPESLASGDFVLTLGAGDIVELGPKLLDRIDGLSHRGRS